MSLSPSSPPPPPPPAAAAPPTAPPRGRKWLMKAAQLLVAVVGIYWVCSNLTIRDRVNVVLPGGLVQSAALTRPATAASTEFHTTLSPAPVPRSDVVSQPDRKIVRVRVTPADPASPVVETPLLGLHLAGDINRSPTVESLVIQDPRGPGGLTIGPDAVVGGFRLQTPRPVVETGLMTMAREANPWLLALAILVFPVTVVITTVRWDQILRSQQIRLPYRRVFVLNMVGAFYNSFFPGSTGGDFLKAYYVSRQTTHKVRAMLSVFVDRVIGLLGLVILGGSMAAYGFLSATDLHAFVTDLGNLRNVRLGELLRDGESAPVLVSLSPTARACLGVALVCLVICVGSLVGAAAISSERVRRALGSKRLLARLPMQQHLGEVREALRLYKANARRVAWWIVLTFPIHITVVLSAMIAGRAFGLSIEWPYYFVCVPVMVLVAALPISPQGAGVMEWFGFLLLAKQGATVSEVLALTLSIRFVQLFWNLVGGLFAIGGQFGSKAASYDAIADEDAPPGSPAPAPAHAGAI